MITRGRVREYGGPCEKIHLRGLNSCGRCCKIWNGSVTREFRDTTAPRANVGVNSA